MKIKLLSVLLISILCVSIAAILLMRPSQEPVQVINTTSNISNEIGKPRPHEIIFVVINDSSGGRLTLTLREMLQTMNSEDPIQVIVWVRNLSEIDSFSQQVASQFNGSVGYIAHDLGYFHLTLKAGDVCKMASLDVVSSVNELTTGKVDWPIYGAPARW